MASNFKVDYTDNPDIAETLSGLSPGDKVTLEVELTVVLNDANGLTADISTITADVESDEPDDAEPAEPTRPSPTKPVSLSMIGKPDNGQKLEAGPY